MSAMSPQWSSQDQTDLLLHKDHDIWHISNAFVARNGSGKHCGFTTTQAVEYMPRTTHRCVACELTAVLDGEFNTAAFTDSPSS